MVIIWIVFFKSGTGVEVRGWVWERNSLSSLSMCFEWRRLRLEIWHHMVPWALLGVSVVIPPNTSECSPQSKKQTKKTLGLFFWSSGDLHLANRSLPSFLTASGIASSVHWTAILKRLRSSRPLSWGPWISTGNNIYLACSWPGLSPWHPISPKPCQE